MPSNLLNVDTGFPDLSGDRSTDEKFRMVSDYLYMLLEQLRYSMANLGMENFNRTELDSLAGFITKPVYVRLESAEGDVSTLYATAESLSSRMTSAEGGISSLVQTVEGFTLSVKNGAESSTIQLLSNGVELSSQLIHMDGLVTFTGLENGTTVIDGACIRTGSVIADVSIESPTIRTDELNIFPKQDGGGSFNLYGQFAGSQMHMFSLVYTDSGGAPYITFSSPVGAFANWSFYQTYFSGNLDFSEADVTGLYLRFT